MMTPEITEKTSQTDQFIEHLSVVGRVGGPLGPYDRPSSGPRWGRKRKRRP
jgi:hypothetical protein